MEDIIVYGAGGHGRTVIDVIEDQDLYRIAGVLDDDENSADTLLGYPVIVDQKEKEETIRRVFGGIVAIADGRIRSRIVSNIESISPKFNFVDAIHPAASISRHAEIGQGAVIMFGVRIGVDVTIGNHCILCPSSLISHENALGDYVFVGPAVSCSGRVSIGAHAYILSGSVVINNTLIGHHTVVGSASNVVNDLPPNVLAYGNPAKIIRSSKDAGENLFRKRIP
ncbi:MAG: NeuD/PglB/VioB family sugar acetyltransferase [Deltaproteobacteria bacterium]|nr:NeuD/PglB/VioB family sugar acetyltransferase [Deltaproteobacteria bacterium]